MSLTPAFRVVPLSAVGDATRIRPLVETIFGGVRRPGWFDRKLARERIDPTLSQVALSQVARSQIARSQIATSQIATSQIATPGDPEDPQTWIGYALVGLPPSRWPTARTAGTGVLAAHRHRGVGRALLDAAAEACRDAGAHAVELQADRALESFYASCGFVTERRTTTLVARGRGTVLDADDVGARDDAGDRGTWDEAPAGAIELHAWLREAWEGTADDERRTLRLHDPAAVLHITAEHDSWVIHRTQVASPHHGGDLEPPALVELAVRAFDRALDRLPRGDATFAVALPEVSSITHALRARGWLDAQRASIVVRTLQTRPLQQPSARPLA